MPELNIVNILWAAVAGICFGLCAFSFSWGSHRLTKLLKESFQSALLRAFIGGVLVILAAAILRTDRYLGLGIPVIVESFQSAVPPADFLFKMIFTLITLSAGFKGGEVTPFVFYWSDSGKCLGLDTFPPSLKSSFGDGSCRCFCGAANTPPACILMGLELFGSGSAVYVALACVMSYVFSGHAGIYHAQRIEVAKKCLKKSELPFSEMMNVDFPIIAAPMFLVSNTDIVVEASEVWGHWHLSRFELSPHRKIHGSSEGHAGTHYKTYRCEYHRQQKQCGAQDQDLKIALDYGD